MIPARNIDSQSQDKTQIAVTDASPQSACRLRLQQLDRILARDPDATDALLERAGLLRQQGLFEEAKRDYLESFSASLRILPRSAISACSF